MKRFPLFITMILLTLSVGAATPTITSVSGNPMNGNPLIISGSAFGTKTQVPPLMTSYDHPTAANNWAVQGTGAITGTTTPWYNAYNTPMNRVDTAPLRTLLPQSSIKVSYDPANLGGTDYHPLMYIHNAPDRYAYISWWMYRDYNSWNHYSTSGANTKFFRLWTGTSSERLMTAFTMRNDAAGNPESIGDGGDGLGSYSNGQGLYGYGWNIDYSACGAGAYSRSEYSPSTDDATCRGGLQQWEHWELYYDLGTHFAVDTPGTDGRAVILKNGKTLSDCSNIQWSTSGEENTQRIYLVGQVTGGRTVSGGHEYLDEVYIDNSPAHVMITDKSELADWARSGTEYHSEIQVPSSWSDDSITFTLNQGSFPQRNTVYLYVVDGNGDANPRGYPIVIGNTSVEYSEADTDDDGCIDTVELLAYVNRWKASSNDVMLADLIGAIVVWKQGACNQ
jgi:hypothetical protein